MKEEFRTYLEIIGLSEPLRKRVESILEYYKEICPEEITAIIVTDYIQEDGSRVYENLWFFSNSFIMESKQFISNDDFDITSLKNRIEYWQIQKSNYDFKKASETSRLYLKINIDTGVSGSFKTSKENCDYLKDIIHRYIKPNLMV